ncbi:MAG: nuclear transport factor 2 family protein [Arenibacterium sp.]
MSAIDVITRFFDAWGIADETERTAVLAAVLSETSAYADPRAPDGLSGRDKISEYIGHFSANAPGWTAQVVKSDETNGVIRVTVAFGGQGPDGTDMVQHGQYFCRVKADQIAEMTGFVGTGAPE